MLWRNGSIFVVVLAAMAAPAGAAQPPVGISILHRGRLHAFTSLFRKLLLITGLLALSSQAVCAAPAPGLARVDRNAVAPPVLSGLETAGTASNGAYGRLPLSFEPNVGQFDPEVRYVSRGGGYTLVLTDTEAVMVLRHRSPKPRSGPARSNQQPEETEQAVVRMKLVGERPARWEGLEKQSGISNYLVGNDPSKWRTGVPNYGRVTARGVYRGIDLVCYGNRRQLEYDLVVEPGADPREVQLAWEGADSMRLNAEGDLVLETPLGDVVQKRPHVYQDLGGRRVEVASRYALTGGNHVRFELARYDKRRPLTVDPLILRNSTYLGGNGTDSGNGIAVDSSGSAYITGSTSSTNFPTHTPYQSTPGGGYANVFITKLTPQGNSLVYSTYVGGSGDDEAYAIAIDSSGAAYVTGTAGSHDFPVQSSLSYTCTVGFSCAFVTKLTADGTGLAYSFYLSGSNADNGDGAEAIAVDASGYAYVAGTTNTSKFPIKNAYQTKLKGQWNGFVTKVAQDGNSLVYSTFLGGNNTTPQGIAVDSAGAAYVVGNTEAEDFPTQSPFQGTYPGGVYNGFLTKLAPAGNALVYSTYLGGSDDGSAQGVAVDSAGSAYVVGYTIADDFPTYSFYRRTLQGGFDGYVTKFTQAGNALVYSTYLGGSDDDKAMAVVVDGYGSAYVTGQTKSDDFPTLHAYATYGGNNYQDVFVTRMAPAGNALVYSTYIGGSSDDIGLAIALDATGCAYVTGSTTSTDFPVVIPSGGTKPGQGSLRGTQNAFVTKVLGNPFAFTLSAPANGATGVATTPTATWNASSNANNYNVLIGTSSSPSTVVGSTTDTSLALGTLSPGTTYYWQVEATNSGGWTYSDIWSFTTAGAATPAPPVLVSPNNGATGVTPAPALSWSASSGAASYDVFFGTSSQPPFVTNTTATSYAAGSLISGVTYYWQIVARNAAGTAGSAVWSFTTGSPATGLRFVPVTPCRVADTRGNPLTAGSTRSFPIVQSGCGIPASASAYSLNVTVVPKGYLGYLSLWPTGQSQPGVSTLNSWEGIVVANAALVPAGTNGAVSVYVSNDSDVILDTNGYFDTSTGASSFAFYPATPCRVADTRGATGQFGGPSMDSSQPRAFPIPLGGCAIPANARGYSLNFTVVPSGYLGFLTTWPTGQPQPNASTLNSWTGKVVANAAIVPAGTNESVSVYVSNPTNVILDINGYFAAPGGAGALSFYPVAPCRVADTRGAAGPFGGPEMGAGTTRAFGIPASGCNIPSAAAAYSLNVTVVPDGYLGYLSAWPAGSAQPTVSTLNSWDGTVVANAAIVPAGTNGAIDIYVTNPTHVILDIDGYFAP